MAEPPLKPVIQTPPGYRHPANPGHAVAIPMPQLFRLKSEGHRGRGWLFHCCCIFWILVLVIIFAFAVAAALIFFIYKPRPPVFSLRSFQISNLNITKARGVTYLNADTAFGAEVGNPNGKMRFNFGEMTVEISVEEGEVGLGWATVPAFTVREKEASRLEGEASVRGEGVDEGVKGRFEKKEVVPRVEIRTSIGVSLQGWKMGNMEVSVRCGGVSWNDMERGIMPKCTFTFLVW